MDESFWVFFNSKLLIDERKWLNALELFIVQANVQWIAMTMSS